MTTNPDVPLRMELTFELPATPEQVWEAIATGPGISSWFLPTDLEEREGGTIVTHIGETDSPGTVTGWEPRRRLAYEEPDWAALAGHEDAPVTPLATEFLIEARSGGTCVLRVVSSAFGTGADWEQEFFDNMADGWRPFFERLRLYLVHFPGQRATVLELHRTIEGTTAGPVLAAMRRSLGVGEPSDAGEPGEPGRPGEPDGPARPGQVVDARGMKGQVEHVGEDDVLLRVTDPVPGLLGLAAFRTGEDKVQALVHAHLFSDAAPAFVERERPGWRAWLEGLEVTGS